MHVQTCAFSQLRLVEDENSLVLGLVWILCRLRIFEVWRMLKNDLFCRMDLTQEFLSTRFTVGIASVLN